MSKGSPNAIWTLKIGGHFCPVGSKIFNTGIQYCKIGIHGILPSGAEQVGAGRAIFEGKERAGSRLGAVARVKSRVAEAIVLAALIAGGWRGSFQGEKPS